MLIDLMEENSFTLKKSKKQIIPWKNANADKTEYLCFNKKGDISALNGGSLKLVGKFKYLGGTISSTENDIKIQLVKAWVINYVEVKLIP